MIAIDRDEKKKILGILKFIKDFLETHPDEQLPVRIGYIKKYIEKYSASKNMVISQSVLSDIHDPKEEFTDSKNTVRVYVKNHFKPFLKKFFETEGKSLPYELVLPDGQYNELKLIKRKSSAVIYNEHQYFSMKFRPYLVKPASTFLLFLLPFFWLLIFTAIYVERSHHYPAFFAAAIFLLIVSLLLWPIGYGFYRLSEKKFVFFHFRNLFLRLTDNTIILASYSGTCPICNHEKIVDVVLPSTPGRGYKGRCREHPNAHTFSFDYTSFTGEKI